MGSIGTYMSTQLYTKMPEAPPKNLTISETEIGWFEIMAYRAIIGKWIKSSSPSQNIGLDMKKSCVKFQTDSMAVSSTATVASMADQEKAVVLS